MMYFTWILTRVTAFFHNQVTQAVFPFPKQYAQWKEGCFMAEPGVIPTTRGPFASQVGSVGNSMLVFI